MDRLYVPSPEREIVVYALYGLTEEEIAIVEGNTTKSSPPTMT